MAIRTTLIPARPPGTPLIAGTGPGGGGTTGAAPGTWYEQEPVGVRNGVNVDFYLDYVPITPPTGSPPVVPVILTVNGSAQSPYVPRYTLAPGSNHIAFIVPPLATDELICWYFTGPGGVIPPPPTPPPPPDDPPPPTGLITTATLNIWMEFIAASGVANAGAGVSTDNGVTWNNPYYASGVGGIPATWVGFALTHFHLVLPVAPLALADYRIRLYTAGTLYRDAVDTLSIYELSVDLLYANGATRNVRPTNFDILIGASGSITNGALAYDADTTPPVTHADIVRAHYSGLSDPNYLSFGGWV